MMKSIIQLIYLALITFQLGNGFAFPWNLQYNTKRLPDKASMRMIIEGNEGIDVSLIPQLTGTASDTSIFSSGNQLQDLQNVAFLSAAVGYLIYERRPRGMARDDLLSVRQSDVVRNSLGVFSKSFIPKGTLIGIYPGVVRTLEDALYLKSNEKAKKFAQKYFWSFNDGRVIDPTDRNGQVPLEISYLFGLIKVSTTMCRLNEPAPGKDVNVYTKINGQNVEIYAERNIFENEELFIDYGEKFDRSDYEDQQILDEEAAKKRSKALLDAQKRREEEEMLTLQPISQGDIIDVENVKYDTDTTNPDGYLSKLSKREGQYKNTGILSPEEGSKIFTQQGPEGAFGSAEDKELIDSLFGGKKKKVITPSNTEESTNTDDEDLYASFLKQIGQENAKVVNGASDGATGKFSEDSLFNDIMGTPLKREIDNNIGSKDSDASVFAKDDSEAPGQSMLESGKLGFEKKVEGAGETRTVMSPAQARELSDRLDALSDEEVEEVFNKLRGSLGKMMQQQIDMKKSLDGKAALPKTPPIDSAVRQQYNEELSAVEKELEKMYDDPLKVWQDLMKNPEKYMDLDDTNPDEESS